MQARRTVFPGTIDVDIADCANKMHLLILTVNGIDRFARAPSRSETAS